jgi:hypothetical protein
MAYFFYPSLAKNCRRRQRLAENKACGEGLPTDQDPHVHQEKEEKDSQDKTNPINPKR